MRVPPPPHLPGLYKIQAALALVVLFLKKQGVSKQVVQNMFVFKASAFLPLKNNFKTDVKYILRSSE